MVGDRKGHGRIIQSALALISSASVVTARLDEKLSQVGVSTLVMTTCDTRSPDECSEEMRLSH